MVKYEIRDKEAGNSIEECSSLKEAQRILNQYEKIDKIEGTYTPEFYEIVEVEE